MKQKLNLALITIGVIIFLLGIFGACVSIFQLISLLTSENEYIRGQYYMEVLVVLLISSILMFYVKKTNFGINKSEVEKAVEEREKLKIELEIQELKDKITNKNS